MLKVGWVWFGDFGANLYIVLVFEMVIFEPLRKLRFREEREERREEERREKKRIRQEEKMRGCGCGCGCGCGSGRGPEGSVWTPK